MYVLCGDAHYGDREISGQTDLINILTVGAMDKTSDQPQVMLSLFSSNSLVKALSSEVFACLIYVLSSLQDQDHNRLILREQYKKEMQ